MATNLVYLCGLYNLLFAVFHLAFWRLFRWKTELAKLHPANRAIMQVLNLRLIYLLLGLAGLCWFFPQALLATPLGRVLLWGMAGCWAGRLVEQLIFFRLKSGLVHLFSVLFLLGAVLHALPLLMD